MPLKTILLLAGFLAVVVGALFVPLWGVVGYVVHYCLGVESQWWSEPIRGWGIRYAFILAAAMAVGMVFHWKGLRYGRSFLAGPEKLMLVFLGVVWLSVLVGEPTEGQYGEVDHPSVKLTKVLLFCLMMTHIVTTPKRLDYFLWAFVAGAFVLGWQAWTTPYRQFASGRLESVGGPDFRDANTLGAYLVTMLPLIAVQFLRSGWLGRAVCLVSGVFAVNAVVLTRSRGAMLGVAASGLAALIMAPKRHRLKIVAGLVVVLLGGLHLADKGFIGRAITVTRSSEERDPAAQARIEIWRGSLEMLKAHPLGVGAGNFYQQIGRYAPGHARRDAHSTYVRCYGELGVEGFLTLAVLIGSTCWLLRQSVRRAQALPRAQMDEITNTAFGVVCSMAALLACSVTRTLLYVEFFWWVLAIPVVVRRVTENVVQENLEAGGGASLLSVDASERARQA